ncbi:MAG TPA: 23S ribosomal RNA methyltransferase Erm [Chloroflexota bacterium]|nr:23S ribosomal RNA methyltransferase Erm [Chloroflexota bacterium]
MHHVLQPSIVFSQNFLHSPRLVDHLIAIARIGPGDTVLEIGPGKGIITAALARRCRRVVAIEKDPRLAARLHVRFDMDPLVEIRHGDALHATLPLEPYKVVANIPFACTTEIVTRLTSAPNRPEDAYLVVQREAAARFMGRPRGTLYAALLYPWFDASVIHRFQRADFAPPPAVEAVLLRLRKRGPPLIEHHEATLYRDLVAYLFTAWQPTVRLAFEKLIGTRPTQRIERDSGIPLDVPPSNLYPDQWAELFTRFHLATPRPRTRLAGTEARLRVRQACLTKSRRTSATPNRPAPP